VRQSHPVVNLDEIRTYVGFSMQDDLYVSAEAAAEMLGVNLATLYAYVSRKKIRSQPVTGSRRNRYWKADIERVASGGEAPAADRPGGLRRETDITLITEEGPHYRGENAVRLSETRSVEDVAALLWQADRSTVFGKALPNAPAQLPEMLRLFSGTSSADRATSLFPVIEIANPRAYDLTRDGMCQTGVDVLRWLAAFLVKTHLPSSDPLHVSVARGLGASEDMADLIRRVMVLSADHGFEPGTYAVRAVASTGVTPYRSVLTGLSVSMGRRTKIGRHEGLARLLDEIAHSREPQDPLVRRMREGEEILGFGSNLYKNGDPRARAVLQRLNEILAGDADYRKLKRAIAVVQDAKGLEPDFALTNVYLARRLGMDSNDSLFILGRAVGWIAHSIEQYEVGGVIREPAMYTGPLPA
jgi:citrate synthase